MTSAAPPITPPMGWNNWDSYGLTIGEAEYRANAEVLASLKKHGWTYAVIDMGWYMANPNGADRVQRDFAIDGNGRVVPTPARFPSAASRVQAAGRLDPQPGAEVRISHHARHSARRSREKFAH